MPTRTALVALTTHILLLGAAHAATPRTLVAKVERVSDGDTITAFTSGATKLRVLGDSVQKLVCAQISRLRFNVPQ